MDRIAIIFARQDGIRSGNAKINRAACNRLILRKELAAAPIPFLLCGYGIRDMPKFRKKPVEVEARRFETNNDDGSHIRSLCDWIEESLDAIQVSHDGTSIKIETLEGVMEANVGDWIIRGVKGEYYPCKPDIFDATYDPV